MKPARLVEITILALCSANCQEGFLHLSQEVLDGKIFAVTSLTHLEPDVWDKVRTRKTLFIPQGQLGMFFTQKAFRSVRLLSVNSRGTRASTDKCLGFRLVSVFCFAGRTLEVLARGEALVRWEHRPLLHGHPAGHADQTRLQVCGSQRGEERNGGRKGERGM